MAEFGKRGTERGMIGMIKALYKNNKNKVRPYNVESTEFGTQMGLKKGCVLSPLVLSIVIDDVIKRSKEKGKGMKVGNWKMKTITVQELMFADDMVLTADSEKTLQQNLKIYQEELKKINMEISTNKTNTKIIAAEEQKHNIIVERGILEQVKSFNYLGTIIEKNGKIEEEINERIGI